MPKNRSTSYLYRGIAITIVILGIAIFLYGNGNDSFMLMLVGIAVGIGGGRIGQYGQRHGLEDAEEVLANDKRSPILYLRSFGDEVDENGIVNGLTAMFGRAVGGVGIGWGRQEQEALAGFLKRIGPYITVGRPGESLPDVGAAWKWIEDDHWKLEVGKLVKRACLIVVHAGRSDGLKWEFQHLVKNVDPKKILLIVPRKKGDYLQFRDWVTAILPKALPQKIPPGLLVIFNKSWQPQVLKSGNDLLAILYPFFKQNNIDSPHNALQA